MAMAGPRPWSAIVWRDVFRLPPSLRLDNGAFCSMCDHLLTTTTFGWRCEQPSCGADWDFRGLLGCWVVRR